MLSAECNAEIPGNGISHLILKEDDVSATLRSVVISEVNQNYLIFSPDKGAIFNRRKSKTNTAFLSPLLCRDGGSGLQKACDAILIKVEGESIFAAIIDLKSGVGKNVKRQLENSECFLRFLVDIFNVRNGNNFKLVQAEKTVLCRQNTLDKRPISINQSFLKCGIRKRGTRNGETIKANILLRIP